MIGKRTWIALLMLTVTISEAAIYYVATNGSNANIGSQLNPWLTITYSATQISAGDTVRVQPGTYNERVTVNNGGTSVAWVTFVADGQAICRAFDLLNGNYIRVIGFEITHTNFGVSPYTKGIIIGGTVRNNIELIDNYIHDVESHGIWCAGGSSVNYLTIRGNRIVYTGHIPNLYSNSFMAAIAGSLPTSGHLLAEYNIASKNGDFINLYGTNVIVRNNYLHDYNEAYWTNAPNAQHSDMFQAGSDLVVANTRNHLYEHNFTGDSRAPNSHFGLWQDTTSAGDTNIVVRGNVGFNFGGSAIGVISTDHVVTYNNTFSKMLQDIAPGYVMAFFKKSASTDFPNYCMIANTIIDDYGAGPSDAIYFDPGVTGTILTNNLGYLAGSEPSYISTNNPLFVNGAIRNYHLQSISPARATGTNLIWVTTANGTGTTFNVNDGNLLCDGWGMVDGDTVTVGGITTRITGINGDSVTVTDSVTWTNGMPVYWGTDITPDIGALPYGSTDLTTASLAQNGTTYTVTPTGDTRGVWFYVDGIPATWDSMAPFTATIASGTVTAKAYALYAQANPVVLASLLVPSATIRGSGVFSGQFSIQSTLLGPPSKAITPTPANSAGYQHSNAQLSWVDGGGGTTSYDVYFDTVNPPVNLVSAAQPGTTFNPGTLTLATAYFWRIDSRNSIGTTTGDVWTFNTGTPIAADLYIDFESGTPGDTITTTYMDTVTHGADMTPWLVSIEVPGFKVGSEKFNLRSPFLVNSVTYEDLTGTRGLDMNHAGVNAPYYRKPFAAGFDSVSCGFFFKTTIPANFINEDIVSLELDAGNLCVVQLLHGAGCFIRAHIGSVPEAGANIAISTDTWYWITSKNIRSTSFTIQVYETVNWTLLGTSFLNHAIDSPVSGFLVGINNHSTATTGHTYIDNAVINWTTAPLPLGP